MAEQALHIGGNQEKFAFAIDPETNIPCWLTDKDELWLLATADGLYDYAKDHPILLVGSALDKKDEFAFTMKINNYKAMILSGTSLYFRDMSLMINDIKLMGLPPFVRTDITYMGVVGTKTDHLIHAVFEGDLVRVDVCLK